MTKENPNIPEEEQLKAVCQGIPEFYNLLKRYTGKSAGHDNFRHFITITRNDLISYIRKHPQILKNHLHKKGEPKYHEQIILEYNENVFRVYEMDHDEPKDIKEYSDFAEATADYLIFNLGLPPGFF